MKLANIKFYSPLLLSIIFFSGDAFSKDFYTLKPPVILSQRYTGEDYSSVGFQYYNANQFESSIMYFREALRISPTYAPPHYGLCLATYQLRSFNESIGHCSRFIGFFPDHLYSRILRAQAYLEIGEKEKARPDLIKANQIATKEGNREELSRIQQLLAKAEINIPPSDNSTNSIQTPVVNKKTRDQLVNRACSMAKQNLTEGEILNQIYRLTIMNANPAYRYKNDYIYGSSIASQMSNILTTFINNSNAIAIQQEAQNIVRDAKKKCKF